MTHDPPDHPAEEPRRDADRPHPARPSDLSDLAWGDGPEIGERAGDRIGPYRLEHLLGEGGFGMVWLAEQTEPIKRRVAVKLIKPGMDSRRVLRRFEDERRAMERLEHPGVARILDAGVTPDARPFVVMEYVDGLPIDEAADTLRLDVSDRLRLFLRVCSAVQHAHQRGIIHRDLKPSNVLVATREHEPVVKIIDFGIARALEAGDDAERSMVTEEGRFVGTPEYMSPEQSLGPSGDADTRADIYALGVILYKLLSGVLPFDLAAVRKLGHAAVREAIRHARFVKPSVALERAGDSIAEIAEARRAEPKALVRAIRGDPDWIVTRAMRPDREERYASASEFAADIDRHLTSRPVSAGPPSARYRIAKFIGRNRRGVIVAGMMALLAAAALIVFVFQALEVAHQRDRATAALGLAERRLLHRDAVAAHEALLRFEPAAAAGAVARVIGASEHFEAGLLRGLADQSVVVQGADGARAVDRLADGTIVALTDAGLVRFGTEDKPLRMWPGWEPGTPLADLAAGPGGAAVLTGDGRVFEGSPDDAGPALLGGTDGEARAVRIAATPGGDVLVAREDRTLERWTGSGFGEAAGVSSGEVATRRERWIDNERAPVAIAGTPGGTIVASAGFDGRVLIWEAGRARPVRALVHPSPVRAIACAGDGTIAVGEESGRITVWDARTGERVSEFDAHRGPVTTLRFFHGESWLLASGSADRTVKVWELYSDSSLGAFLGHAEPPTAIVFPDPNDPARLRSVDGDGPVRAWTLERAATGNARAAHAGRVRAVDSPEPGVIRTRGSDGSERRWRLLVGGQARSIAGESEADVVPAFGGAHDGEVVLAAESPDGARRVSGDALGRLVLWDATHDEEILTLVHAGPPITALAFTEDGSALVVGTGDGRIETFPPAILEPIGDERLTPGAWVMDARIVAAPGGIGEERAEWIEVSWASTDPQTVPAEVLLRFVDDEPTRVPVTGQQVGIVRLGPFERGLPRPVRVSVLTIEGVESPGMVVRTER